MADETATADNVTATEENPAVVTVEANGQFANEDDEAAGIAVDGYGLPINHRLRAERLADLDEEDPAGNVSPELIADAKDRLAAERKARPPVAANMKVADLERIAKNEGVDLSTAANNADRVALIENGRAGIAPPSTNEEPA